MLPGTFLSSPLAVARTEVLAVVSASIKTATSTLRLFI
jgi:hypothetical protein